MKIRKGMAVTYKEPGKDDHVTDICTGNAWHKGRRIVGLRKGQWCYRDDVVKVESVGRKGDDVAKVVVLAYEQGDRLVLVNGVLVYAEDPRERNGFNVICSAEASAQRIAEALGVESPEVVRVPTSVTDSENNSYATAVDWYNSQPSDQGGE